MRVETKTFLPQQNGKNLSSEEWTPRKAEGISSRGKSTRSVWKLGPHKRIKGELSKLTDGKITGFRNGRMTATDLSLKKAEGPQEARDKTLSDASPRGNANQTKCHLPLIGMAALKTPTEHQGLGGSGDTGTLVHWRWEAACAATVASSVVAPPNLKDRIPARPSHCASGHLPERMERGASKRYLCSHVHSSISHKSPKVGGTHVSTRK